ncbi:MAG: hypothetical protein EAZ21_05285 [Betaproteobacteria bacterium]|nr:MAG: hypothetical protein EAZ21_05285 [Betaproteobacteria bacterium]
MNRTPITRSAFAHSHSMSTETLAALHDTAKGRAQTLRREAISRLIDGAMARLKSFAIALRSVNKAGVLNTKRSVNLA